MLKTHCWGSVWIKLVTWVRSYFTDRSIKVVLSGQLSVTLPISASVARGSILGPLLFSLVIDDLSDECGNQLYLYADNSTLQDQIHWWPWGSYKQAKQGLREDENLGNKVEGDLLTIKVKGYDNMKEKHSNQAWTSVW